MVVNDIAQLLINSSGAALVAGMFLWYLIKYNDIVKQQSEALTELAKQIQHLSDVIDEQKDVIKDLYKQNLAKVRRITTLEGKQ